jgi:hypothetical protein
MVRGLCVTGELRGGATRLNRRGVERCDSGPVDESPSELTLY